MPNTNWQRIEQIFFDALERSGEERARFLFDACAGDESLRAEVEAMLDAHEGDRRLSPERWEDIADASSALIGKRVGPYRIERIIGHGGMGEVYLASRDDAQYEHKVAIKVMRAGLHAAETSERFRRERQILAHLEHPHIASLLDGGVTDDGRPYLVMQYVDGVAITDYCDQHALSLRERLVLFRSVCAAVTAAHVQLVVHRDLKPANILVTVSGDVKLLDFGIAKLLEPGPEAPFTRPLERVMTPEHAAPEQVRGEPVTTATDVYALGVLLYQLLTGERPLKLPSSSASDVERIICEVEPSPPSAAAKKDGRALRGDLDKMVLMALRKEPTRRYQSAQEFDADVAHYLAGMPVLAQHDTFRYRARKFASRNRWGVVAAGAFAVLVVAFVIVTVQQSRRVAVERDRAVAERNKAEKVVGVLTSLFEQSNPFVVPGGDTLRVSDFVAHSEKTVSEMKDQPEVQARMWEVLGSIQQARGNFPKALTFFARADSIYEQDPDRKVDAARALHLVAQATYLKDGGEIAEPLLRASLERHRALLGDSHPDVGAAMRDLAGVLIDRKPDEASQLLEAGLVISRQAPSNNDLALAADYNALGTLNTAQGNTEKALEYFQQSLEFVKKALPADHPNVLTVTHNLAATYSSLGDMATAEKMEREILATKRRILGNNSPEVAGTLEALAVTQVDQGKYQDAQESYLEALQIYQRIPGGAPVAVASTNRNIGVAMALDGRPREGVPYLDQAVYAYSHSGRPRGTGQIFVEMQAAFVAYAAGQRDGIVASVARYVTEIDSLSANPDEVYCADGRMFLGTLLLDQGNGAGAEPVTRRAAEIWGKRLKAGSGRLALAQCLHGASLVLMNRVDEGRTILRDHHDELRGFGQYYPLQRSVIENAMRTAGLSIQ